MTNKVQQIDREVAAEAHGYVLTNEEAERHANTARLMRERMEAERIAPLEAENKRLREALWFYAREANWRTTTKYMSGRSGQTSVEIDSGSRARQALAGEST